MIILNIPTISPTLLELIYLEQRMKSKGDIDETDCIEILDKIINGLSEFIDLWGK